MSAINIITKRKGSAFMGKEYKERTLEECIQKVQLLEKQNVPKNLLTYELMLNLPEDVPDIEKEEGDARQRLAAENLSSEERKYIEAKLVVLDLMKRYGEENN